MVVVLIGLPVKNKTQKGLKLHKWLKKNYFTSTKTNDERFIRYTSLSGKNKSIKLFVLEHRRHIFDSQLIEVSIFDSIIYLFSLKI